MSSPRPRAKRPRDDSTPNAIKRHKSLYFVDGDVVLLSLPKDGIVTAFKVDKVFLLRHSPVFKDMFSLPQPGDVEKYDAVPLIRLQDEAKHLISFLKAIYDPASIPFKKHDCDTISKVEGILKLSTKYQIERLRVRIVDHLSADWPSDLSSWDRNEEEIEAIKKDFLTPDAGPVSLEDVLPEPCSVIRLARDCNIPGVLPAAFYHLSRLPPFADIGSGIIDDKSWEWIRSGGRVANFSLLSRDDLMCLVRGSRAVTDFIQELSLSAMRSAEKVCPPDGACWMAQEIFRTLCEDAALREHDPLHARYEELLRPTDLCDNCYRCFKEKMCEGRSKLWESLPGFFGLPVPND